MSTVGTYRLAAAGCPVCLRKLDAASNADPDARAPEAGDVTVCLYCRAVLEWGTDMQLKRLSDATLATLGPIERHVLERLSAGVAAKRKRWRP